jgi:hypothetical protein
MTPQEFIDLHFSRDKSANVAGAFAQGADDAFRGGMRWLGKQWGQKGIPATQAVRGAVDNVMAAPNVAQGAGRAVRQVATGVGNLGKATATGARRGLNYLDDAYHQMRGMQRPTTGAESVRLGNRYIGASQQAARNLPFANGTTHTNALNPFNLGVGAGALGAGYKGTQALIGGGNDASPNPQMLQDQTMANNAMQRQMQMQMQQPNNGGGGIGGLWNSIPMEARYAIGAGLPLMLAGGLMGGRGGMGLGALGLGAAGLGAAGAGYFGDGPRRLVGQGANALYNSFSSGANDPMSQIRTLGSLSPEFGTTALMGRMPGVDSNQARGMYDMLTQNQGLIEPLLQQLQSNSVGPMQKQFSDKRSLQKIGADIAAHMKQSRCWAGYEPVPGAKAYSRGSCRPVNSKKTQKEMKSGDKASK